MANLGETIHTGNVAVDAIIDVFLAIIVAGVCIAIPAYGAAAFESEVLGLATYAAFVAGLVFVFVSIVRSGVRLYRSTTRSSEDHDTSRESDEIVDIRDRYTRGEISEEELESETEKALEKNRESRY